MPLTRKEDLVRALRRERPAWIPLKQNSAIVVDRPTEPWEQQAMIDIGGTAAMPD